MEVYIDTREFKSITMKLVAVGKEMPQASVSALNRTIDHMATQTKREVAKIYAIKQADVAKTLKKNKASISNMDASLRSTGHTFTLYNHFNVNPKKPPETAVKFGKGRTLEGKGYKVKVKVKKAEGMQQINTDPKPFIASANNSTQIFKREGAARKPVSVLRTLSVPQMVSNEGVSDIIMVAAQKKLQERITHEVEWRLKKAGGK